MTHRTNGKAPQETNRLGYGCGGEEEVSTKPQSPAPLAGEGKGHDVKEKHQMAKLFQANDYTNGAFSIVRHEVKGIATKTAKPGSTFGTMDADDAPKAVTVSIELADKLGLPLDRWSYYIAGVSEKLGKADKHLPVKALKKAVKDGFVATVEMGKFSHPRITLRDPQAVVARTSTIEVLA